MSPDDGILMRRRFETLFSGAANAKVSKCRDEETEPVGFAVDTKRVAG